MRIVLCYPVESRHLKRIRAAAGDWEVVDAGQEGIASELFRADIFCGHAKVPVDWDGVVAQGRLRWIQSSAAGMDHCLVPSVIASPITVTSASGVLADQVAEHTIALATALSRSLPLFFRAQEAREFVRRPTRDLHRSTVGIAGFGGVGRRLAQLLAPFRTRILATDLFPVDKPRDVAALWPPERLDDLLGASDFVVLCLPLNEATRQLFDGPRLHRIRRGAYFLNMARGPLVDTAALIEALRDGHLAGAGVDVTDPEPLPPESPLWELQNAIITPHVGGQSARRIDDMTDLFCENLRRYRQGEPLINLLTDKTFGFPVRDGSTPLWVDYCAADEIAV